MCYRTHPAAHHADRVRGIRQDHRRHAGEAHRVVVGGIVVHHRTGCAGGCRNSEVHRSNPDLHGLGFEGEQDRHSRLEGVSIFRPKKNDESNGATYLEFRNR